MGNGIALLSRHLTADDSVKMELQTRVRVMDDALKQNALQMNACENARKDLELKDKRNMERIMVLEVCLIIFSV